MATPTTHTQQTPFSKFIPVFAGACGLSGLFSYLNSLNFKPIETMGPEYKTKENIIVSS